jgi:S-adenosylmethionine synthetase
MHISLSCLDHPTGDLLGLEIVERKGLGHPDTICDEIMEQVSLALSRFYLAECGQVLASHRKRSQPCDVQDAIVNFRPRDGQD